MKPLWTRRAWMLLALTLAATAAAAFVFPAAAHAEDSRIQPAIAWGEAQEGQGTYTTGDCLTFVHDCYADGAGASMTPGFDTPLQVADATDAAANHGDTTPPRGAWVYWDCEYQGEDTGHVAMSLGDGEVLEAWPSVGVEVVSQASVTKSLPDYIGWSAPPMSPPMSDLGADDADSVSVRADFNGDGRTDTAILTDRNLGINVTVLLSTGTGFTYSGLWYYDNSVDFSNVKLIAGDFNGDGRSDLAVVTDRNPGINVTVLLSTGTGFTYSGLWYYDNDVDFNYFKLMAGDFNGDVRSDLVVLTDRNPGVNVTTLLSSGTGFTYSGLWYYDNGVDFNNVKPVGGDFNGDGLSDLALLTDRNPGVNVTTLLSTGTGFTYSGLWYYDNGVDFNNFKLMTGDFNGDGRSDLALLTSRGPGVNLTVLLSSAAGFDYSGLWFYDNGVDFNNIELIGGDFNGDGRSDIAYATNRGPGVNVSVELSTGSAFAWQGLWYYASDVDFDNMVMVGGGGEVAKVAPPSGPDTTPPITTVSGVDARWHNKPVTLTFYAVDSGSGVDYSEYRLELRRLDTRQQRDDLPPRHHHGLVLLLLTKPAIWRLPRSCTVRIDTCKPKAAAYPASVSRGKSAKLRFRITDPAPSCGYANVTIVIKHGSHRIKTLTTCSRCNGAIHSVSFHCSLARGRYTWAIAVTDLAGNKARVVSAGLVVK